MLLELVSEVTPLTLILTGLLASLVLYWLFSSPNHKNLPPGPSGLPIVGYLPFIGPKPHEKFDELGKKYGPVFSLYLGRFLTVVLTDFKSVKEAFSKEEFLGRPKHTIFNLLDNESPGIIDMSGEAWREQKRFALQVLRDLGLGRPIMEGHIMNEIDHILEYIRGTKGEPFDLNTILLPSMSNNISALVFGESFPPGDKRRKLLDTLFINEQRGTFNMTSAAIFMPWIVWIVKKIWRFKTRQMQEKFQELRTFFREAIKEHEKTLDENNIRDYIDAYLLEVRKRKGQDSSFKESFLIGNCVDFFFAGSETVQVAVIWLTLLMASYPEIQSRVQKEIDDVIGDRTPQWKDNAHMPYVNAVIAEMHRIPGVGPLNLPRGTTSDTTVGGYFIPKGTVVFGNFYSVHRDPKVWNDPDKFDPERFYKKKVEMSVPFSYGKRSCPGEGLANVEVFLYFVSFMQNFTVSLPEGVKPDFSFILEIGALPILTKFCMRPRKK